MMRKTSISILLCAAVLSACDENAVQDITGPLPSARIKFFNFGVDAPGVNFYADDTKLTAISSTDTLESTLGTEYGDAGSDGLYSAIDPGEYTFSGRIAAETDKDLPISSVDATIAARISYSFYQTGFYDEATKAVDAFIVEDPIPAEVDPSIAHVRLINAIANSEALALHVMNTQSGEEFAVGDAVGYQEAGTFTAVPAGVYDLSARYDGSGAAVIARTEVSFFGGRVYTIGALGDMTAESDADDGWPSLDSTENR